MSSIRIDAEAMERRAEQLYGRARDVGAVMEGLDDLSASLRAEWEGAETDAFARWFREEFRPNLIGGQQALGKMAGELGDRAREMAGSE